MTTLQDLEAALGNLLSQHGAVATPGKANDAFEIYVLSLVLRAATEERGIVEFESASGFPKPNPLRFRTSPGRIFSPSSDYSHAVIRFPAGLEFEAHIGVYVQGLAGVNGGQEPPDSVDSRRF